jgi:hypothetical protein
VPWPVLTGSPIHVRLVAEPHDYRGDLLSGGPRGTPIDGASFLRRREIVLDQALLRRPGRLALILSHEVAHFAWTRLGNPLRWSYQTLLDQELRRSVPGELGWPSALAKQRVTRRDRRMRSRVWRDYTAESFCDTFAWLCSGVRRHADWTLPDAARRNRRAWFRSSGLLRTLPV